MIKAAVIGHPISHSLSPLIHQYWFKKHNIDAVYHALDIAPADLNARVHALIDDGYAGFNVTVPHKQKIMQLCDDIDDTARAVGAVNTALIKQGRIIGCNTDAYGYIENIKNNAPSFDFRNKRALVLGAGGAARAVVYGLLDAGFSHITLTNRTQENAQILARDFKNVDVVDWNTREKACIDADLLTNTTVLGMKGQEELPMDLSYLPDHALVCDIVYKPLHTTLIRNAQARNLRTITGIGMLLHQARPAFAAWTNIWPDVDEALIDMITARALS